MIEGDDMAEHLNKFRELATQVESLSGTGKGIDNNELVTLLSLSLPESYEPIIMALQSRADDVTFDIFSSRLLQESARRQVAHTTSQGTHHSTSVTAFAARPYGRGRGGSRYNGERGGMRMPHVFSLGRSDTGVSFGKAAVTSKPRGKCFYCQKEGYWKRDCNKRKADEGKVSSPKSPGDQTGLAFTVHDLAHRVSDNADWIVDSGASQHLCSKKESFVEGTYRGISGKGIEIADGSRIEAVGMGDVSIGQLHLSEVLHVPRAGGNLISVARLIDAGFNVSFGARICIICREDMRKG